jgi:virginiamycin B lyase
MPRVEVLEARELLAAPPTLPPLSLNIPAQPGGIVTGSDGALWFTQSGVGRIGRMTTSGQISEFPVPNASGVTLADIVAGPDGALWFTESDGAIGRMTTAGAYSRFPLPARTEPVSLATGADGNLWISEIVSGTGPNPISSGFIGKLPPTGALAQFALPNPGVDLSSPPLPGAITSGPDGALWFLERAGPSASFLSRISTDGIFTSFPGSNNSSIVFTAALTSGPDGNLWVTSSSLSFGGIGAETTSGVGKSFFPIPDLGNQAFLGVPITPPSVASGPDGNLWFTYTATDGKGRIGRVTTDGVMAEFTLPVGAGVPGPITEGPDGALWFVDGNATTGTLDVGRITPMGAVTDMPVPSAQLPVIGRLDPKSDHGADPFDGITNDRTPRYFGLAQPGATVTVTAVAGNGSGRTIVLGHARANRTGQWSITSRPLADGTYQVFLATSGRGIMPSSGTPASTFFRTNNTLVIDTVAPRIIGTSYDASTRTLDVIVRDVGAGAFTASFPHMGPTLLPTKVTKHGAAGTASLTLALANPSVADPIFPPQSPLLYAGVIQDSAPAFGDRYTVRLSATSLSDLAGNALDGEFHGRYPTGNGRPGGDFVITVG